MIDNITTIDREIDDVHAQEVVRWRITLPRTENTGLAEFEVYSLHSVQIDDRELLGRGAKLMTGCVQSDGQAKLSFAPVEWVEFAEWRHFMALLGNIFARAFDLMGTMPPATDKVGMDAFVAARAMREQQRVAEAARRIVDDIRAGGAASIPGKA